MSTFAGTGRLRFSPTTAPDDTPVWVDITAYLRTESGPVTITRGRQSELDTVQPSLMTATLDNTDNRFTFGLTTGPYGANWTLGKRIEYAEVIGDQVFTLFTGYIEAPDIDNWQPIGYHEVMLSATDRLTRLSRGTPFLSTLGAQISQVGVRAGLSVFYPMGDTGPKVADYLGAQPALIPTIPTPAPSPLPVWSFASAQVAPGDDLQTLSAAAGGYQIVFNLDTTGTGAWTFSVTTGQVLTLAYWLNLTSGSQPAFVRPVVLSIGGSTLRLTLSSGQWLAQMTGALSGTATGPNAPVDVPKLIVVQYDIAGAALTLWLDGLSYTASLAGSDTFPAAVNWAAGALMVGGMAYLQVYCGPAAQFGPTQWTNQWQVGLYGLGYQTTGQRINTLLDYAGVPGDQRAIDKGVGFLQAASLAGSVPGDAIQAVVDTERGRGFASGDGKYVFHDRTHVYNV